MKLHNLIFKYLYQAIMVVCRYDDPLGQVFIGTFGEDPVPDPTKAVPSTACFIKLSEDEMFVISKYKPSNVANSFLLVTDFQGYRADDKDIYEDILFD